MVDKHIPTESLDALARIDEIEVRATCEGSGPERPTFFVFKIHNPMSSDKIEWFVQVMNSLEETVCGAEIGNMGFYRVGVTAFLWYEKDKSAFTQWCLEIPIKIHGVLVVIQTIESS